MTEAIEESVANGGSISELEAKIIKQVEYYFGDKNLPRDKFLMQKIKEDEDGWVTLECLLTFNRLKSISGEAEVVAKALKKSEAGLVEVHEDNTKVRRNPLKVIPANTEEARLEAKNKTIYCKPFPKDISMDALEAFFSNYGKVVYIMMRRTQQKIFKGSVFVEFSTEKEAKDFLALESLKYEEEELITKTKEAYFKGKGEEFRKRREEEKEKRKVEREEKEKQRKAAKEAEEEAKLNFHKGCVLHFEGGGEQTSREDIKELFGPHEDIAWVDFSKGETEGYVRFNQEGGAQRAIDAVKAANDGNVILRDVKAAVKVLEGDEEKEYWKKVNQERDKARSKSAGKRAGRDSKKWWKGKRKPDKDGSEPPAKAVKKEEKD